MLSITQKLCTDHPGDTDLLSDCEIASVNQLKHRGDPLVPVAFLSFTHDGSMHILEAAEKQSLTYFC